MQQLGDWVILVKLCTGEFRWICLTVAILVHIRRRNGHSGHMWTPTCVFCVLLTVHLSIILHNEQLDAHLRYFTIYLLHFSTCFVHYKLIIRRLNRIDAAPGIVLSVSDCPVHRLAENCSPLPTCAPEGHWLRGRYQMLHQYSSTSWWWAYNARNM
jgi:hypothetical protein